MASPYPRRGSGCRTTATYDETPPRRSSGRRAAAEDISYYEPPANLPQPRRSNGRRGATGIVITLPSENFVHSEDYFTEDILLDEQPIVGEPSLELLRFHRHIAVRVGPELAVHYINTEKFFNKSAYAKDLCSRMTKISSTQSYRVDFPHVEEQVFVNLLEWINTGLYTPYKDTFRGSFLRHLKLHILAIKFEVEGLIQFTLKVVADMLIESHPEQITRGPFWATVANLTYKYTTVGEGMMRRVITEYTLWYLNYGRGRFWETKTKGALKSLKRLQSACPIYRVECLLLHDNPWYFKDTIETHFGETREVSLNRTRWWKDPIEDPMFETWIAYWYAAGSQGRTHGYLDPNNYRDSAELVKGVDDEDKVFLKSYEKEFGVKYGKKLALRARPLGC